MSAGAHVSSKTYLVIGGWLAGLMILSVVLSYVGLEATTVAWIVFALSTIKASLVAMYYMHLKSDNRIILYVAAFPFLIVLVALFVVWSSILVKL